MSSDTTRTSPLAMYDITIPCDRATLDEVRDFFRIYCKRWCFQQEQGAETGYLHYQCRISLISKKRVPTMITWLSELKPGWHVSPTSNPSFYTGNEFYVMKVDTRIDGPWSDREDINTTMIPTRLRAEPTWKPWQQTVIDMISVPPDDRVINVIVDTTGNNGKSFLTLWLMSRNKCERIPQQKDARDIMRMIMNLPKRTCYFIDLPRGTSHKDQNSVYAAIEEIKNGYCYDDRYCFKREIFEPPHVWVFTNELPQVHLLSRDRWCYWKIIDNRLQPYQPVQEQPHQIQHIHWGSRGPLSLTILSS